MKKRTQNILSIAVSAMALLTPAEAFASMGTPDHAPAGTDPEKADTLVYSATKTLIESFGELTKTASKLSETALKLLEAQENMDSKKSGKKQNSQVSPALKTTGGKSSNDATDSVSTSKLKEISEEIVKIGSEINQSSSSISGNSDEASETNVYISDEDSVEEMQGNDTWTLPEANREGGKYIWIPDNNLPAVEAVLNGQIPTNAKGYVNLNEMTYWRGDSIPMALPTKRLGRYDRKLYNWLIYPKGLWHLSLSANYGELSTEDSEFLSLIQDVDLKGKIYSVKPSVSYFLRNNLCVGLRLAFTKGDMSINSFKVDIDEDMSFDLHDIKYSSDSYAAAVFIQQYFGLSRRGRFAVFNEAELSIGTGNSHFIRPYDGELRDTRTKTQSFNINYSPGVSIMMMKNAAFNLSFGIFGFHLKDEKQWENGEEAGSRFTSGINFRFNLFNINFGVSIII